MREPTYREALIHAWQLVWHHKILWIFGLLSVFIGQFGLGDFFGQIISFGQQIFASNGELAMNVALYSTRQFSFVDFINLLCIGITVVSILILVVFVAVTAQGALVAVAIDWYKKHKIDSTAKAWHKGVKHFWKVLAINALQKLLLGALLLIVLYVWATLVPTYGYDVGKFFTHQLAIITLALVMFLAFIVASVYIYALGYVMSDDDEIFDAIHKGWKLFTLHVLVSIELNLLLLLIGFLLVMFLVFGSFIVLLPSLVLWLLSIAFSAAWLITIGEWLAIIMLTLLVVVSAAIFNAFATSAWVYLFMNMHHEGIVSRFGRWAHRLFRSKIK